MIKIGIVSYTDPRSTEFAREREKYIEKKHQELTKFLDSQGFEVINPLVKLRRNWKNVFGIRTNKENEKCHQVLLSQGAEALIICVWHWTEPQLPLALARDIKLPIAFYTEHDPAWAGSVGITASAASFWESAANDFFVNHTRFLGNKKRLARWARGVGALQKMKKAAILLWGGSYCLRMEHLQDDIPLLKTFIIGDVLSEDQYILIKIAEDILKSARADVDGFISWLKRNGGKIEYDGKMLTPEVLQQQVALYLAARQRLNQLKDSDVLGVSIKCQPELSEIYGCTACTLPAFLPFGHDAQGAQPIMPTVCEGDIKGLLTAVLLHQVNPEVPPLFGDLKFVSDDYITLSNCGASAVFYAANSNKPRKALSKVTIGPQCQGAAGGAIGYDGLSGEMTVARLGRVAGRYVMQIGLGKALTFTPQMKKKIIWGQTWPHVAISLKTPAEQFIERALANHYIATPGNFTEELHYACQVAGIDVEEI